MKKIYKKMSKNAKESPMQRSRNVQETRKLGKRLKMAKIQGLGPDPQNGPFGPMSGS